MSTLQRYLFTERTLSNFDSFYNTGWTVDGLNYGFELLRHKGGINNKFVIDLLMAITSKLRVCAGIHIGIIVFFYQRY